MQLIEVSLTGVRSAVITLQSPATAMRIILFPMVHLGSPDYYRSVTARLAGCDLIVAEGISGKSVTAWALTLAYRLPARSHRLALTVQDPSRPARHHRAAVPQTLAVRSRAATPGGLVPRAPVRAFLRVARHLSHPQPPPRQ